MLEYDELQQGDGQVLLLYNLPLKQSVQKFPVDTKGMLLYKYSGIRQVASAH